MIFNEYILKSLPTWYPKKGIDTLFSVLNQSEDTRVHQVLQLSDPEQHQMKEYQSICGGRILVNGLGHKILVFRWLAQRILPDT